MAIYSDTGPEALVSVCPCLFGSPQHQCLCLMPQIQSTLACWAAEPVCILLNKQLRVLILIKMKKCTGDLDPSYCQYYLFMLYFRFFSFMYLLPVNLSGKQKNKAQIPAFISAGCNFPYVIYSVFNGLPFQKRLFENDCTAQSEFS